MNVATSLLAQVDAAIGGKTGVNLPEGKNLVGAFWQPSAVLCDTETLATLPPREWASGRGEIAKYALLEEADHAGADSFHELALEEQVARCVAIKAAVVAADEREGERRMILNYGHTLAHALEAAAFGAAEHDCDLRHGEAVAVGTGLRGPAGSAARSDRRRRGSNVHRRVVSSLRPVADAAAAGADSEEIVSFMARDKKARHDLTFVLDGPEGVEAVRGVDAGRRGGYPCRDGATCGSGSRDERRAGPSCSCRDRTSTCSGSASRRSTAPRPWRTTSPPPPQRRPSTAMPSSTCSRTTRATWSRRSTRPADRADAIIVNAGALTHTSWSLHDALAAFDGVVVELHLSNPAAREPFRHTSIIAPVADGCIAGFGGLGYPLAVEAVAASCWPAANEQGHRPRPLPPLEVAGRLGRLRPRARTRRRRRTRRSTPCS